MYATAPVQDDSVEYRSVETMKELTTLIVKVKNSDSKAIAFAELNAFLEELPYIMEVVDIE